VRLETALEMTGGYAERRGKCLHANLPVGGVDERERLSHRTFRWSGTRYQRDQESFEVEQELAARFHLPQALNARMIPCLFED
jgi:hypothetical protein